MDKTTRYNAVKELLEKNLIRVINIPHDAIFNFKHNYYMNRNILIGKFKVITLCGSLKFLSTYLQVQITLERLGHACFSVSQGEGVDHPTKAEKIILDKVHFKKILMSDCILVIDNGGYIGESTQSEIQFAVLNNIPVYYLSQQTFLK